MSRPTPSPRRSPLTPFYIILGLVALVGAGVLVWQLKGGGAAPTTAPVQVVLTPDQLQRVPGISVGRPDAPVVIYEFADFQCGGCAQFAQFTAPLIKERLVDAGKVRYVYYDYPLISIHQHAFLAARAGRCANEKGKFWEYHDVVYGEQGAWSLERDPTKLFVDYAERVGLDRGEFESCLRSDRFAREVTESMKLAESLGVQGTPTVFVNGKRVDQADFRAVQAAVEAELNGAAPSGAGPATPAAAPPS